MPVLKCKVISIENIISTVYRVILRPEEPLQFYAGQYVLFIMGNGDKRAFSIASSPHDAATIELHLGASELSAYALEVVDLLKQEDFVTIELPRGDAELQEREEPLLLVAGGTGYSYTRSILLAALERMPHRAVTLYWGVRKFIYLYELETLQELEQQHINFTFIPVIENPPTGWQGEAGVIIDAIMRSSLVLSDFDIYVGGSVGMVKSARDSFCLERKVPRSQLHSDALAFMD